MNESLAVSEEVAKSVERVRWAVLIWLLLCAITTQVLTPPVTSVGSSAVGLAAALACAFLAVIARGVARASGSPPRTRLRAWLTSYVASALLGAVGLGIFFLRGDATQALGCALGGAIFAASGAREAPARRGRDATR